MSLDSATPKEWDVVSKPIGDILTPADFEPNPDMVNRPHHYNKGKIEAIEAIRESMEPEQFKGYLKGNILKYVWRYEYKNGIEDLRKAEWYLKKLIEVNL